MPTVRPTASRPVATSSTSRSCAATSMALGAAEQLRQIDLQPARVFVRAAGNGRRLVLRKDDRVFRANPAAGRATLAAVIGLLDQDRVQAVDAVHAEQAEVDALHAIRAAAVIDHRIPPPGRSLFDANRSLYERCIRAGRAVLCGRLSEWTGPEAESHRGGCCGRHGIRRCRRFGCRTAVPAEQIDGLDSRLASDPPDLVEIHASRGGVRRSR